MPDRPLNDRAAHSRFELIAGRAFERAAALQSARKSLSDPDLQKDLLELCNAARDDGHPAEGLILQLKRSWGALPSSTESHDRNELVAQLVSLCIREYYREGRAGGQGK